VANDDHEKVLVSCFDASGQAQAMDRQAVQAAAAA